MESKTATGNVTLFNGRTKKNINEFISDLEKSANEQEFIVVHKDKSSLSQFYKENGVTLPQDVDLRMVQICRPDVSGKSLHCNPDRSAFIQKFIFVSAHEDMTAIRFIGYSAGLVAELLGHNTYDVGAGDDEFAKRLESSFQKMKEMIEAAI